jgi:hypothetical protein
MASSITNGSGRGIAIIGSSETKRAQTTTAAATAAIAIGHRIAPFPAFQPQ